MSQTAKQIYLDYAAGTPCSAAVVAAMQPYFSEQFANPSSIHKDGVLAKQTVEKSRESIALHIGVKKDEVFFMSGGTESINTAILGVGKYFLAKETFTEKPHIIASSIEHPAVLEPVLQLEREGCKVSYVQPNNDGIITEEAVKEVLQNNTVLVTVGLVNGEIGVIQPIRKIAKLLHAFKLQQGRGVESYPYMHTDAAQAPLVMSVKQEKFLVDLISLDGSKMYGPKFGLLGKKHYVPIAPILFGGSQEKKLRPGTENVPYVVGITEALDCAQNNKKEFAEQMTSLKEYFTAKILEAFPGIVINGSTDSEKCSSLITNVCFQGHNVDAEFLLFQLDAAGIAVSAMTACKSLDDTAKSYVVDAVTDAHNEDGVVGECAGASIRFSFGKTTTKQELDYVITTLQLLL